MFCMYGIYENDDNVVLYTWYLWRSIDPMTDQSMLYLKLKLNCRKLPQKPQLSENAW